MMDLGVQLFQLKPFLPQPFLPTLTQFVSTRWLYLHPFSSSHSQTTFWIQHLSLSNYYLLHHCVTSAFSPVVFSSLLFPTSSYFPTRPPSLISGMLLLPHSHGTVSSPASLNSTPKGFSTSWYSFSFYSALPLSFLPLNPVQCCKFLLLSPILAL